MSRPALDLPDTLPFVTELEVRIGDVNYGGHLGNDALVSLLHEARVRYFRSLGYTERDVEGSGIIMTDLLVLYRSEAFPGDRLRIEMGVTDHQPARCGILYRATNAVTGAEVARARTGIAFFDYTARKVAPMPPAFRLKTGGNAS